MKLERLALVAEIASSIAVVVTLMILVVEIRGNTDELRAGARQSLAGRSEAYLLAAATAPELATAVSKVQDGAEISSAESWLYQRWLSAVLRNVEEAYLQHEEGRLDDEYWQTRAISGLVWFSNEKAEGFYLSVSSAGGLEPSFDEWFGRALRERNERIELDE